MTADLEFEGKNVKDALNRASITLGLSIDNIRYDILSYGSTGLFGLVGAKKARIKITHKKDTVTEVPKKGKRTNREIKAELLSALDSVSKNEDENVVRGDLPVQGKPFRWQPVPNAEITPEIILRCRSALDMIAGAISDDITIIDEHKNGRLVLNMLGGNSGALIGKRGRTLEAIQYLIEKIINKGRDDRVRIMVDVEGYLENRRNNLQQLANKMAEKAKKKGRPATIGQMNAHDRRIIHLALKDDDSVRTQSVGEGHFRKLVIFPKNAHQRRRRRAQATSPRR